MSLRYEVFVGTQMADVIENLAALRIAVFREWPYLYDGDLAYERDYLANYARGDAILVAAYRGDEMVGASTGISFIEHAGELSTGLISTGLALEDVFYCAESVLFSPFRGQGAGHEFFDLREAHGRANGYTYATFCAVQRPFDHPARPAGYRPHDAFWAARGYAPVEGGVARLAWRDLGDVAPSEKPMQFWMKRL